MAEQEKRLTELMQGFDRVYEEYAKANGVSYASLCVLEVIYEHPEGCTQKQICEEIYYPKQSVNLSVKSFWKDGYVELREAPADRRNKLVVLTGRGKAYADGIVGRMWRADDEALSRLTVGQREELLKLMGIYEKAYSEGIRKLISE